MALDNINLGSLLKQVEAGKIQLPEFQRGWKWDDDRILSLLATVSLDYPLGVVMTLENGGDVRFKTRAIEGTDVDSAATSPERLLLDGQQRLTALYQALLSQRVVETEDGRHKELKRWYYVDIEKAITPGFDREDAFLSVPEDRALRVDFARKVKLDLTSRQKECAAGIFPLNIVFDYVQVGQWQQTYVTAGDPKRWEIWPQFTAHVLDRIRGYAVPLIQLPKETDKAAVCAVFEKVNTGGVVLNVFELLTATYAGDRAYAKETDEDFNLADAWATTKAALETTHPVLAALESTDYLQAIALAATYERRRKHIDSGQTGVVPAVGCKRRDLLGLPLADHLRWSGPVAVALDWVGGFLREQSVFRDKFLPYRTQLAPLAAIRAVLGERADEPEAARKIARWYWCGVFGELYHSAVEGRFSRDLEQVVAWVEGNSTEPDTVKEATFQEQRLATLTTRNSAAYKGMFALIVRSQCYDWYHLDRPIDAEDALSRDVDIRLIFTKGWEKTQPTKDERINSVVNKTVLSYDASKEMGAKSPAIYLESLAKITGQEPDWLDDKIETHLVDPSTLRAADFDAFYKDRTERLLDLVEEAMGKRTVRAASVTSTETV